MAQIITVSIIVDEVKVDDCRAVVENAMKEALEPYLTTTAMRSATRRTVEAKPLRTGCLASCRGRCRKLPLQQAA